MGRSSVVWDTARVMTLHRQPRVVSHTGAPGTSVRGLPWPRTQTPNRSGPLRDRRHRRSSAGHGSRSSCARSSPRVHRPRAAGAHRRRGRHRQDHPGPGPGSRGGRARRLVLAGRCYDLTETPPYGPWLDLVATYRRDPALPAAAGRLRRRRAGARHRPGRALRRGAPVPSPRSAATGPTLVLLEDLHWADPASLDLLRHVAPHCGTGRSCSSPPTAPTS